LIEDGLVRETAGDADARSKILSLTTRGKKLLADIDTFARAQVFDALKYLSPAQYAVVAEGLGLYAQALAGETPRTTGPVTIAHGYAVNVFARCVELHATFYAAAHGFGAAFEGVVAGGLAGFGPRMDKPRNRLWRATQDERIVGTIAIDGEDLGENRAHLRWFIVDDSVRGGGVGRRRWPSATNRNSPKPIFGPSAASTRRGGSTKPTASPWPRNAPAANGARRSWNSASSGRTTPHNVWQMLGRLTTLSTHTGLE
jgi:hypothetical protein